ncbi:protein MIZU-KUSSEI 1 [Tripterygium wilfordii]|uniref:protein MIZU-KUSSEI 1 n=1 Tax=Tripterygium wilfordii TaxID=458696 RepID=UPI0018F806D5|nr:protein MIZU-KUSSEI 1 [Tripterygium wilfordii]
MTKIDDLRRFILPCIFPSTAATTRSTTTSKKRLSTSLRDDLPDENEPASQEPLKPTEVPDSPNSTVATVTAHPRPSKTMVICTIFGTRKGHVWFCVQHDRLSSKPTLLLELSIPTHQFVQEMRCGLVRVALESDRPEFISRPLRSVPVWTLSYNGKRVGFAVRRRASEQNRLMLKTMQSMTVGAGVIPAGFGSSETEEIMYMRANYEHIVGSADSESFHLINPDECSGQELSVFLMRSR